jgi:flagellar hook-associated protein 1 FlgK
MSTFSGLSSALSALYAQRQGLDTTGQNIANVNTVGYSRQRAELASVGGSTVPTLWSTSNLAGGGVQIQSLDRMADQFLNTRARTEHANSAYLDTRKTSLSNLELVFAEPSDTGLASQLGDMWAAFHDVANNPGDLSARSQLLQQAGTVATTLNAADQSLVNQWSAQREQVGAMVTEVNGLAANVAELNQAILRATQAGLPANDLSDQRDTLVGQIIERTGAVTRSGTGGSLDVFLGGNALVRGSVANSLKVTGAGRLDDVSSQPVAITWSDGRASGISGGELGATIENLNVTIPGFRTSLNGVAASMATSVNTAQLAGFDLNGTAGTAMFTGTTAATIAVGITDPKLVAASRTAGGNLDGGNATAMAALANSATGPDSAYRAMVVSLGVMSQTATRRSDIQTTVTNSADAARESVSGVNLDEEMANMLSFQRGYEAAGRMLTAVDQALDTLINRTGLVGR